MKIVVRKEKESGWKVADPEVYKGEKELQQLLYESPSLIPINEIGQNDSQLIAAVQEFGLPGSGSTDIIAFDKDGGIAIIECKLAANAEIKRKVVGQILEYGAYLWNMSYQEVDEIVKRREGKSLAELVSNVVDDEEWDVEYFKAGVEKNLKEGAFSLIIAVDEINEELRRTIQYLNTCGPSMFSINALEMSYFKEKGLEILIPHIYGVAQAQPTGGRKQWTERKFFSVVEDNLETEVISVIKDIYKFSDSKTDRVKWGTGVDSGSFTFHYLPEGATVSASVFSVFTNGKIQLNLGWLFNQVNEEATRSFFHRLKKIKVFSNLKEDFRKWPNFDVADVFVNNPEGLAEFKEAVIKLGEDIKTEKS